MKRFFVCILVVVMIIMSLTACEEDNKINDWNDIGNGGSNSQNNSDWIDDSGDESSQTNPETNGFIEISSEDDLRNIGSNPSGNYILTNDIDLSRNSNWNPLCSSSNPFTGTLDGNGYCIKNINVDMKYSDSIEDSEYAGLFCCISGATIKNLGIVGGTIEISSSMHNGMAGALAGSSKINDDGENDRITEVSNCWADVTIKSTVIENDSTSFGATMAVGSFLGEGCANFTNCYSVSMLDAANSYADQVIGGFIGRINTKEHCPMTIEDCYNLGLMNGRHVLGGKPGGFIGYGLGTQYVDIVDSYYGTDANEYNTLRIAMTNNKDYNFTSVTGLTVDELKLQSNFVGFDFDNVWDISVNKNDGYPFLKVQKSLGGASSGNNQEDDGVLDNNQSDDATEELSVDILRQLIIGEWQDPKFSSNNYTFFTDGSCRMMSSDSELGTFEITEDKTLKIIMPWTEKILQWDSNCIYSYVGWYFTTDGNLIIEGNVLER